MVRRDSSERPPSGRALECAHFGRCGGCTDLATPAATQFERKVRAAEALLAGPAGLDRIEHAPGEPARHYRTKLLYPVQPDGRGRPVLGIYARGTHDVVGIRECAIQDPALTELAVRAERVFRELRLEPYDERDGIGFVRALHARLAPGTGELLVGVTTRGGVFAGGSELAAALQEAGHGLPAAGGRAPRVVGVIRSLRDQPGNVLLGERHVPLAGRDYLRERSGGLQARISFGSFHQVHRDADRLLYRPALALLGDVRGLGVVDAYGGIGAFGLRLAAAGAASVLVVEASPSACRDAVANADGNRLPAVQVRRCAFAAITAGALPQAPDLLVVDPPRAGLGEDGCRAALSLAPARILHVACSAKSLAADLARLTAGGYVVTRLRAADLFPYTEHLELIALLEQR